MREITVREANQDFSQVIAGETIVFTKNGRPVAKITPQSEDRADDPEWQANFAALKNSLRSKHRSGYRVLTITEDDTCPVAPANTKPIDDSLAD